METLDSNLQTNNSISINEEIRAHLLESAKWAKFLSIIGFIGLGLMVLASIVMMMVGSTVSRYSYGNFNPSLIVFIYILMAVLYFFPVFYLFQFSNGIKRGINSEDQVSFASGIKNMKLLNKYLGILTIVIISIYILAFIIGGLIAAAG